MEKAQEERLRAQEEERQRMNEINLDEDEDYGDDSSEGTYINQMNTNKRYTMKPAVRGIMSNSILTPMDIYYIFYMCMNDGRNSFLLFYIFCRRHNVCKWREDQVECSYCLHHGSYLLAPLRILRYSCCIFSRFVLSIENARLLIC